MKVSTTQTLIWRYQNEYCIEDIPEQVVLD